MPASPVDSSTRSDLKVAFRIAVIYLCFAAAWILLSDRLVELIVPPDQLQKITWFQTVKGLTFVVVTAGLLMLLVVHRLAQIRRAERRAAGMQQRLQAFVSHFPGVVYIRDAQSRFVLLSGQLPEGAVPPEDLIGRTDEHLHTPETFERLVRRDREVLASGVGTQLLETIVVAGRTLHYLVHRFPLTSPDGEPWIAGLGIDVTERQQAEKRIREMARELAQANRMKDQFLTNLSHELRTPVTAIRLWAEVLRNPSADDMQTVRDAAAMIHHSALTQTLLIEDLLDVTRIIGGRLQVTLNPTRLDDVLRRTAELLQPMADEHHVTVDVQIEEADACRILGDARRVQQVIWNLLTNAIKFSAAGGRVGCTLRRDRDECVIVVKDRGRGIAADELHHVFERFRPAESNRTRPEGGIGVGLSIVKHLVEAHGGTVLAESEGPSQGATFTVRLPVAQDVAARPEEVKPVRPTPLAGNGKVLAGQRILVVEDDADSRAAMKLLLERVGAAVTAVETAEAALALVEPFDLLLSDIGLPEKDGCEMLRELRERPQWKSVPAVACSAYALAEDKTRAAECGFSDFVVKPVDGNELIDALWRQSRVKLDGAPVGQ